MDEACAKVRLGGAVKQEELTALRKDATEKEAEAEQLLAQGDLAGAKEALAEKEALLEKLEKAEIKAKRDIQKKNLTVDEDAIADIVSGWTKIPVKRLAEDESVRLRKLEQTLHKRVIGQEDAVTAVSKAVRRGRVGLKDPRRPIGSFLFLGPTGVGKTEISKALAEAIFGKEQAMIRVDMSEYMET